MPTIHNTNRKILKKNNLQSLPWSIGDLSGLDRSASDNDDSESCNSKQNRNNHIDDDDTNTNNTSSRKRPCKSPSVIPSNLKRISDKIIWIQEGKAQHPAYILQDCTNTQSNDILFMSSNTVWVEWVSNGKKESIYKHQIVQDGLQARKRHRPDYFTEDPSDKSASATDAQNKKKKKARSNSPRQDREIPPPSVVATAKSSSISLLNRDDSSVSLNQGDSSVFKKKSPRCKGKSILEGLDEDSLVQHDGQLKKGDNKLSSNNISMKQPSVSTTSNVLNQPSLSTINEWDEKWEEMFDCLLIYIEETRKEKTKDMIDEQKASWIWDGQVPTIYQTPSGKSLGRWITNQRQAKRNGKLKDDREARLTSIGLRWECQANSSWEQMIQGLVIYAQEQQSKTGKPWDGNVPTSQKIRVSSVETGADEEKALGRWVNRQRTIYQSGKLSKERQQQLEKVGLQWSAARTNTSNVLSPIAVRAIAALQDDHNEVSSDDDDSQSPLLTKNDRKEKQTINQSTGKEFPQSHHELMETVDKKLKEADNLAKMQKIWQQRKQSQSSSANEKPEEAHEPPQLTRHQKDPSRISGTDDHLQALRVAATAAGLDIQVAEQQERTVPNPSSSRSIQRKATAAAALDSLPESLLSGGDDISQQQPVPEFLRHLYSMLQDPSYADLISWEVPDRNEPDHLGGGIRGIGKIVVHQPDVLQDSVLGRYYRHSKYASFQRQLNYFGFKKRLHNSKKGKLSPCSYIHQTLSDDVGSLFTLKRRNPSTSNKKGGGVVVDDAIETPYIEMSVSKDGSLREELKSVKGRRLPAAKKRGSEDELSDRRWQSDADKEARKQIIANIMQLLKQRRPNAPFEWHEKLPQMAKQLEGSLYYEALSFDIYNDTSTLNKRLESLAADIRMKTKQMQMNQNKNPRGIQHVSTINTQQPAARQQSQPMPSLLNGDWQSDDDIEERRRMIVNIMNHCRKRKPDASKEWLSKLPQLAHRLEESLYRSAPSFEAYNDISTLKQRLEQLAINVGMKTKRIQQAAQQPGGQAAQPSTHQQSEEVYNPLKKKKLSSVAARAMAAIEDEDDIIELSSDEDDDVVSSHSVLLTDTSKCQSHAERLQQKWDDMLQCLLDYIEETRKEKTKDMNVEQMAAWVWDGKVPYKYNTPSGKGLGKWVSNQRQAKQDGTLKAEREAHLVSTGLNLEIQSKDYQQQWDDMFQCLLIYIEETREKETEDMNDEEKKAWVWDGQISSKYKTPSGKNLGPWVSVQRKAKRDGNLKEDREARLTNTGLRWSVEKGASKEARQQQWDDMFQCLLNFIEETHKKKTENMNDEEKAAWVWDGNVPTNYKTISGKLLGSWIGTQRIAKRRGTLVEEREARLASTGLKWNVHTNNITTQIGRKEEVRQQKWEDMFKCLLDYIEETRKEETQHINEEEKAAWVWDCCVPARYTTPSGKNLGSWVKQQREAKKNGKLKEDREVRLISTGLNLETQGGKKHLQRLWEDMFQCLLIYIEETREKETEDMNDEEKAAWVWDGNVPQNYKTPLGKALGMWVSHQRVAKKNGKLKDDREARLANIGLRWSERNRSTSDTKKAQPQAAACPPNSSNDLLQRKMVNARGKGLGLSLLVPLGSSISRMKNSTAESHRPSHTGRGIAQPGNNDCLFGREKWMDNHPGNKRYQQIIEKNRLIYQVISKNEKKTLRMKIVNDWRANNGGRFLKLNKDTSMWQDIGDDKAQQYISLALRKEDSTLMEAVATEQQQSSS